VKHNENHRILRLETEPPNDYVNHGLWKSIDLGENGRRTRAGTTGIKRRPNLIFSTDIQSAVMSAEMIMIAVNTPAKVHLTFFGCLKETRRY